MVNYYKKLFKLFCSKPNPFVSHLVYINCKNWVRSFFYVFFPNNNITINFEKNISKIIGDGTSLSFASGRMAFFTILNSLNLKVTDEVLILVPNCSVMYNAIQRVNAKIVPYDVDLETLGSSFENIIKKITVNTKVIVVQHTLGIPCKIEKISEFCEINHITLIEDCALTFDSKINNIKVGNFGDFAIFSFDTTKPINAIIGGIIYSKNQENINQIKNKLHKVEYLDKSFQFFILFNFFINKLVINYFYWLYNFFYMIFLFFFKKIGFKYNYPYLYNDSDPFDSKSTDLYPYPARMSSCFAYLGKLNLDVWNKTIITRRRNYNLLFNYFIDKQVKMPVSYFNKDLEIIPLRFVLFISKDSIFHRYLSQVLPRNSMWFITPLACSFEYSKFGINELEFKNCIQLNNTIFNIPIDNRKLIEEIINYKIYE